MVGFAATVAKVVKLQQWRQIVGSKLVGKCFLRIFNYRNCTASMAE